MDGLCSLSSYLSRGNCKFSNEGLICRRGFTKEWIMRIRYDVFHLEVLEWPGDCMNVDHLQKYFPELQTLDIINSTVLKYFKGHFDSTSKIKKIEIHGMTSLWEVPSEMVKRMRALKVLDLRNNVLRHMKADLLRGPPQLEVVLLSDNNWDCSDGGLDWLAMENENGTVRTKIVDYYELMCHQQLYRGKPLHKVMDIIRMVRNTCPEPCVCAMTHVVSDSKGAIIPLITVDCSRKQLDNPPLTLPPSTTTLRLEGNKIPVYAFDKAFQGNNDIMHVYLGNNPWRCDCHFIPRFQGLLLKYKRVIRDLQDIRCAKSDDKTISLKQISTMPLSTVCSAEVEMPISTMNIVNLILLLLIFIVLGRFVYDWHMFRSTGKLPWISSVLP
ncbi:unnamed protein product [Danaus chrysippus]|uniref:(African queen) hypothetical protein n=1 Tax=Danaus chrysippus TaxID=151541 RepID=A0A8J2QJ73_9NEOP|nr:unnamed protein product [Danaus chrysippus]